MKRVGSLLAVLICLSVPTAAEAESLAPTTAELVYARAAAATYWHVTHPPCGIEQAVFGAVRSSDFNAAEADMETCTIMFSDAHDWRDYPEITCSTYVHEFGHLALGLDYFAASNPTDPAHSPDPTNIMYGGGEPGDGPYASQQQVEMQEASVGCLAAERHPHKHRRTRRRRHACLADYPRTQCTFLHGHFSGRGAKLYAQFVGSCGCEHVQR
jgi:hypothetical protein